MKHEYFGQIFDKYSNFRKNTQIIEKYWIFEKYSNFRKILKFSKNTQIPHLMIIRPVGAELFNADGQTDRHDEANFTFFEPRIVIYLRNKTQQNAHFLY